MMTCHVLGEGVSIYKHPISKNLEISELLLLHLIQKLTLEAFSLSIPNDGLRKLLLLPDKSIVPIFLTLFLHGDRSALSFLCAVY